MKRPHAQSVIDKIRARPHRRILVQPSSYRANRFPQLRRLWKLLDESKVSIIGWDFPYIAHREEEKGETEDAIWSLCDWEDHHIEYWELHKSGQFAWIGVFSDLDSPSLYRPVTPGMQPLSLLSQLYDFTEAFEFSARYGKYGEISDGIRLVFEHRNMRNVVISTSYPLSPIAASPCLDQTITIERHLTHEEAQLRNRVEAISCFEDFLSNFEVSIRRDILKRLQDEYYGYRMGQDNLEKRHSSWPEEG